MEAYQERVCEEKVALDKKVELLAKFMEGNLFKRLLLEEQSRMVKQLKVMKEYSTILGDRIAHFDDINHQG